VLLSVSFLAFAVEVGPEAGVLQFGIGVAVVIGALSLLIFVSRRNHHDGGRSPE
jgi:hypothetical protein